MRLVYNVLLRGLGFVPMPILQSAGSFIGWLLTLIPIRRVRRVDVNLSLCLPDKSEAERIQLRKQALINLGRTSFETPRLWFGPEKAVKRLFAEVEDQSLFEAACQAAKAKNTGVIVLTPHMNLEAAILFLGTLGPSTLLYKPQNPNVEALVRSGRGRFGTRFVRAVPGNVRQQLEQHLSEGDSLLLLPDQDPPRGRGVFAPFFGVAAHSPTFVGRLLENTGAPVVLMQVERLDRSRGFRIRFLPAPEDIYSTDQDTSVAAVNIAMETCIRQCLPQYMWNIPRFRHRPKGEKRVYTA